MDKVFITKHDLYESVQKQRKELDPYLYTNLFRFYN